MKNFYFKFSLLLMLLLPLSAAAQLLPDNGTDHFFQSNNYSMHPNPDGSVHFKILIYAKGQPHHGYNGSASNQSSCACIINGPVPMFNYFLNFYSLDNRNTLVLDDYNHLVAYPAYVHIKLSAGSLVVNNPWYGTSGTIQSNNTWQEVKITRPARPDGKVWLEFDWYPTAELNVQDIIMAANINSYPLIETGESLTGQSNFSVLSNFDSVPLISSAYIGADMAPQLSEPVFYPFDSDGNLTPGYIGIPFMSYQEVYSYYTSIDRTVYPLSEQAGIFRISAADSVQHNFRVTMENKFSASIQNLFISQWFNTNKVDIPAYHKIHEFTVEPYTWWEEDFFYEDTRFNQLSWKIYWPHEQDILEDDYFEIQRAYKSDFSDAQTIETMPINWYGGDYYTSYYNPYTVFSFVDSNVVGYYTPKTSDSVYYRVRRASSALWGWDGHNYAAQCSAKQENRLTSINNGGSYVFKDEDFDNTHKMNICIDFTCRKNGTTNSMTSYWDPNAILYIKKVLVETGDTILIRVPTENIIQVIDSKLHDHYYSDIKLHITDVLNTPCTHVRYFYYVDTTGAFLRQSDEDISQYGDFTHLTNIRFRDPADNAYFTDAANLNSLTATDGEYPDRVLLTWDLTEGGANNFTVETRPNSSSSWTVLGTTAEAYWNDMQADPSVSSEWQYRVTMSYTCNGNTVTDSRETTGSRSPWGRVSGRVHYEDGSGCPGITVVATRTSDGATIQTVVTDESGAYMLDSLPYSGGVEYTITPTSQTAQFRYNNTSSGFAMVNLSLAHCISTGIDFDNISSVRFSGRVLYENSSIPVRDANFRLNGNIVRLAYSPVKTDASGNFEFRVPEGSAFTLQVVKEEHHFAGDGFVRLNGDSLLTLNEALDGVRVWDQTKVRLAGRVAGGLDQRNLPLGFGLSTNNLGDNVRLVLELEGDNISHIVRIPSDLSKDTLEFTVPHVVYGNTMTDTVGVTQVHYQQKRIVVEPDPETGEFCVDLFPVRYKLIQATATGYATLFTSGRTSETIDLGYATLQHDTVYHNSQFTIHNSQYKLTYRSPISITCKQMFYGDFERPYFGEQHMKRTNIMNETIQVPLAYKDSNGIYQYLFGAPVFKSGNYNFRAIAHEDYYYNNDPNSGRHDQVRIKGGTLKVYNGMHDAQVTQVLTKELDDFGKADFTIPIDYVSYTRSDSNVLRVLDLSVESEGEYVESQAVRGYVTGHRIMGNEPITSTFGEVKLLDVLRDPPGSTSYAWIESGAEYTYTYQYSFDFKFGVEFGISIGNGMDATIGAFAGAGGGTFAGQGYSIGHDYDVSVPLTNFRHFENVSSYTFKTNERISTSSSPYNVGQDADVYIGLVQNVYARRVDAVQPIDSLTYNALYASAANGLMATVAEGVAPDSNHYYLVIGKELELKPAVASTFTYTHDYIKNTLIPRLRLERDALLLTCDSATAQAIANANHQVVYQSLVPIDDRNWACDNYYRIVIPQGESYSGVNMVKSYTEKMAEWIQLLLDNEAEKVSAIYYHGHDSVATYSISPGTSVTVSNNYSYSDVTHYYMDYPGVDFSNLASHIAPGIEHAFGKSIETVMGKAWNNMKEAAGFHDANPMEDEDRPQQIVNKSPGVHWHLIFNPILDFDWSRDPAEKTVHERTVGFTLSPDEYSNMDVSIYRIVNSKDAFNSGSYFTRHQIADGTNFSNNYNHSYGINDNLYGSLVFFLQGGAAKCPCELADTTEIYKPRMYLSAGALRLENPKVDIDVHERSNVPSDRPAVFNLFLYNELEQIVGTAVNNPIAFKLKMNDQSNPHGARVYIDGMPLTDGRIITLTGHQIINKTMEVYAGDGYDFEDLVIEFASTCIPSYKSQAKFSVHFMPVSCDVNLTLPRDNWVMNTLSPYDSVGYYLPVSISDFDVNYRGFDHIELQYKIATQSDDEWVNLCSYYADSALYAAASGTKAMIEGGRIENIHFHGERDPMEQRYDLRAVSFCRHGSGFISKSSAIKSGIKDTRRPRVFGDPEPANGILGVGDHLKLRFNEAIAGNYLDEDNNFQLLGVTNRSGIASSTSVYFDGTPSCEASSEVTRVLSGKSFSIDLMAKPVSPTLTGEQELFSHPASSGGIGFGLEPASTGLRLYGYIDDYRVHSLPLEPLTDFTRLIMAYDHETGLIRFYAGTQDVTEPTTDTTSASYYDGTAPLVFGRGYQGNMLEARLWFKALSTDEVVETHEKRLTGYERKLAAYYPMNEGRGDICYDKASGSTLSLQGTTWTTPSGYSLQMNGQQSVTLAQEVLSRSNIQDYTLMFWFRTTEPNQGLFSAGWISDTLGTVGSKGTLIKMVNGHLVFQNGNNIMHQSALAYADGLWHHYVLAVNRTYNHASIYVDGQMTNIFDADSLSGLSGVMMLGGTQYGQTAIFNGHFDDLALFEQALPKNLIEAYDNLTPVGDEMGLIALLPFSKERENSNGIMEEVFNVNNQRIFTQTDGTVVNKIQPLIISPDSLTLASMGDPSNHAPVRERDMLKKMHFDWSFNNDELLININNQDREINKNNIYITVRDVEDLNGNRTVNPSMWQVFVNKNVLLWNSEGINEIFYEQADHEREIPVQIMNVSGQRHQYTIDGMPDWLNVSQAYGNLNPQETQTLVFSVDEDLAVGVYSEIIYLTDENDLSEPLKVLIEVRAICPWNDVNPHDYNHQMSLLGQVMVDGVFDTDPNDVVVAILNGQYVGYQHISYNDEAYPGYLFMTIYGDTSASIQPLKFRLWQASTGRIFGLTASQLIVFESNAMVGIPPAEPVILYTSANEVQNLDIEEGWNWISFNIAPNDEGALDGLFFTTTAPFTEGDQLKSVATQQFAEWDGEHWTGSLTFADYHQMYMMYCGEDHWGTRVAGRRLTNNNERTISLHQGWNSFPYLLTATSGITNAMGDYIDHAQVGDILKSQTQFAVFNAEGHWMGSLTALVPGEGYLLYRNGTETVPFTFHNNKGCMGGKNIKKEESVMKREMKLPATNMTIIATIDNEELSMRAKAGGLLKAYAGETLAGVAEWQETDDELLFFLTVGTDLPGQLNFFLDENGTKTELFSNIPMKAVANQHYGTLDQPVILSSNSQLITSDFQAYPSAFTDHVNFVVSNMDMEDMRIIIRNAAGVTVDEINTLHWTNCNNLATGVYFATLYTKEYTATVKLVKVRR